MVMGNGILKKTDRILLVVRLRGVFLMMVYFPVLDLRMFLR